MKMPTLLKRKKLRAATAARRSRVTGLPDEMDYEQISEPNMKLSRALLIVLVLHVVAVAGIIAFNTIKTREAVSAETAAIAAPASAPSIAPVAPKEPAAPVPNEIRKVATRTESEAPAGVPVATARPAEKSSAVADSGKTYTVVRGDNPVTIARRLHINYGALLELNQIADPRKLQIGTKLHLPEREETTRHKSD